MRSIPANPTNLQDVAARAAPGDRIELAPGTYGRLTLTKVSGTRSRPITIAGSAETVFDGGRRFEDFQVEANTIARRVQADGGYPGLGREAHRGFIRLKNCRHLRLEGFVMIGCWPTGIALAQCQELSISDLTFREGTFAIFAEGRLTSGLTIERCDWIQDVEEGRIWREIDWDLIHGVQPVAETDSRAFDGDFFRSFGIAGDVAIRDCSIRHAFNAIHMYHSDRYGRGFDENRNVRIFGNRLHHIRDNAIEPEWGAWNWWIFHNDIFNCHKWMSFEMRRSGHFFVFGNTGWFDEIPGPPGDDNNGGAVFKTPRLQRSSAGMHYVFNNSFYLRSPYAKNKRINNFWNFNNAIQYCVSGDHGNGACDRQAAFFGYPANPKDSSDDEDKQFTRKWRDLNIRFVGDVVLHPDYPDTILKHGYPIEPGVSADPGFVDPQHGNFMLKPGAPAKGAVAEARTLELPGGDTWELPSGLDAGAWQGTQRIQPPERFLDAGDLEFPAM